MTFQDFIESFYALLRKPPAEGPPIPDELAPLGGHEGICALIGKAHLFHLEPDSIDLEVIRPIAREIVDDLKIAFPAPFDNFAIVNQALEGEGWDFRWLYRMPGDAAAPNELFKGTATNHYFFWEHRSDVGELVPFATGFRFQYLLGGPKKLEFRFSEETQARVEKLGDCSSGAAREVMLLSLLRFSFQVAAVSHPANYFVATTPQLTPREERQVSKGRARPDRKRPYFIVVDHDRLVNLNPATRTPQGTHASPVPHARRGHWRRLSERCVKARNEGRTKTWVGESYVGAREFGDEKNRYRVLLPSNDDPLRRE